MSGIPPVTPHPAHGHAHAHDKAPPVPPPEPKTAGPFQGPSLSRPNVGVKVDKRL